MKFIQSDIISKANNYRSEKHLTLLVCSVIGFSIVLEAVVVAVRRFVVLPYRLDTLVCYGILLIPILYSFRLLVSRIKLFDILFLFVFVMLWLFSFLGVNKYDNYFFSIGIDFVIGVVPCYIVCRCMRDYSLARMYLSKTAIIVTISEFLLLFIINSGLSRNYSQNVGYMILPAAIISIIEIFRGKRLIHIANLVVDIFLLFAAGARGPLICLVLFIALKVIVLMKGSVKNIILTVFLTLSASVVIQKYLYDILISLRSAIVKYGMSVRIIDKLLSDEFTQDSARTSIAKYAWQVINDNPIFGIGLAKDRIVIAKLMRQPASDVIGWYPHNIALELFMQFGLVFGSIALVVLFVLFFRAIFRTKNRDEQDIACLFVSIGVFPLLFSESYLTYGFFFCAIAVSLNINQSIKKNRDKGMTIQKDSVT